MVRLSLHNVFPALPIIHYLPMHPRYLVRSIDKMSSAVVCICALSYSNFRCPRKAKNREPLDLPSSLLPPLAKPSRKGALFHEQNEDFQG